MVRLASEKALVIEYDCLWTWWLKIGLCLMEVKGLVI